MRSSANERLTFSGDGGREQGIEEKDAERGKEGRKAIAGGGKDRERINTLVLAWAAIGATRGASRSKRSYYRRQVNSRNRGNQRKNLPFRRSASSGAAGMVTVSSYASRVPPAATCCIGLLLSVVIVADALLFPPPLKEEDITAALLRDLLGPMESGMMDAADSYLDYQDNPRLSGEDYEKPKEIPVELPPDYDGIDTLNPNPSTRDQEYLRHSTLWSYHRMNGNNQANDRHRIQLSGLKGIKDEKVETTLPAYCTPPNPCPVGYTSENHCLMDFENTAAFSRDYQSAQDCMCDKEHMLDCSIDSGNDRNSLPPMQIANSDFNRIVDQFEDNPFFRGEKLPIAAKKGINVVY